MRLQSCPPLSPFLLFTISSFSVYTSRRLNSEIEVITSEVKKIFMAIF